MKYFQFCPIFGMSKEQAYELAKPYLAEGKKVDIPLGSNLEPRVYDMGSKPRADLDTFLFVVTEAEELKLVDSRFSD